MLILNKEHNMKKRISIISIVAVVCILVTFIGGCSFKSEWKSEETDDGVWKISYEKGIFGGVPETLEVPTDKDYHLTEVNGGKKVKNLYIGSNVKNIYGGALKGLSNLESLTVPFVGSHNYGDESKGRALGYIFGSKEYNNATKISQINYQGVFSFTKEYYIPNSLKKITVLGGSITRGAFKDMSMIETVILEENVGGSIGKDAFLNCTSLKELHVKGVVSINNVEPFTKGPEVLIVDKTESVISISNAYTRGFSKIGSDLKVYYIAKEVPDANYAYSPILSNFAEQTTDRVGYRKFVKQGSGM